MPVWLTRSVHVWRGACLHRRTTQAGPRDGVLNPTGLRDYSFALAEAVTTVLDAGDFPVVLGGDCSIVLGSMLALRRRGRHGLLFIDAHADFYQPEAEPTGEAASMDLALVTGVVRGCSPTSTDEDRWSVTTTSSTSAAATRRRPTRPGAGASRTRRSA